jgi:low temperature requirement protein LtrA
LAGGFAEGSTRTILWLIALAIDYGAPLAVYWVPWMQRVKADVWDVATEHFAERFQLFVIIALGESIVVTGAATSKIDPLDAPTVAAFVVAFLASAALWWLYFNRSAEGSQRRLEMAENRTEVARDVYTYLHAFVVAGVIVSAIGDELVIKNHGETLDTAHLTAVVAGPVIYLLALALIRLRATGTGSIKRPVAAVAIVMIGLVAADASALVVGILILAVLIVLICVEEWTHHRSPSARQLFESEAR